MTITSPHLKKPLEATPEAISDVIASLPSQREGDRFAILGDDPQIYMQALCTPQGFQLEYQEGSTAQHYHCVREDLSAAEVTEVFCDYAAGDIFWKRRFVFECRDIRTPSFRAGFWLGNVLGKIANVLGCRKV